MVAPVARVSRFQTSLSRVAKPTSARSSCPPGMYVIDGVRCRLLDPLECVHRDLLDAGDGCSVLSCAVG